MFISVVHSLLSHSIPSIRRRAMELLSAKLQHQSNFFLLVEDEAALLDLIPPVTAIAVGQGSNEEAALNQQTAFFTLKLLCRFMGASASSSFRPVLDVVVDTISPTTTTSTTVLASAFLCLAELIQNLGVQSLPHLPRYGANLVARLGDMSSIENHDLLLLSVVTAVYKLVETMPQFLVPYLPPILKQVSKLKSNPYSFEFCSCIDVEFFALPDLLFVDQTTCQRETVTVAVASSKYPPLVGNGQCAPFVGQQRYASVRRGDKYRLWRL